MPKAHGHAQISEHLLIHFMTGRYDLHQLQAILANGGYRQCGESLIPSWRQGTYSRPVKHINHDCQNVLDNTYMSSDLGLGTNSKEDITTVSQFNIL